MFHTIKNCVIVSERQKERNEREKERFRKREEERQRKWEEQKAERQRKRESAGAASENSEASHKLCDIKAKDEDTASAEPNLLGIQKVSDPDVTSQDYSSREMSQSASSKSSKRYSDRRKDDKMRKEVQGTTHDDRSERRSNASLDQMTKEFSNILHLEGEQENGQRKISEKHTDRIDPEKGKQIRGRDNAEGDNETRDHIEMEGRKNKVYRGDISFRCSSDMTIVDLLKSVFK